MNNDRDRRFEVNRTLDPRCLTRTEITPRSPLGLDNIVNTRGINVNAFQQ